MGSHWPVMLKQVPGEHLDRTDGRQWSAGPPLNSPVTAQVPVLQLAAAPTQVCLTATVHGGKAARGWELGVQTGLVGGG